MDPLSFVASIITIVQLSTQVLGYLDDVKDASKERTRWATETFTLCSLLYRLRDLVEEDFEKPWFSAVQALAVENGPLDQFQQALETLQSKMTDRSRLKRAGDVVMWKSKKEEVLGILGQIERLKTLVEIALHMDHYKLSQAIKEDIDSIETHVSVMQSGLGAIQEGQDLANHRMLVEWISSTDYPIQQSDIIGRKQEGTGQWFLDSPKFAAWLNGPNGTLFCPGIPGAGKTMVAAIAIDYLLKKMKNSSIGIAYVFCNYKRRNEQATSSMLEAIMKQLVQARPSVEEPIEKLHKKHTEQGTRPSINEIFDALKHVLANYSTVYIVVDALDECSDGTRQLFLAKLQELQNGGHVRLMTTSRFIPDIEDRFKKTPRIEVRASEEDVKRFVVGQMVKLPRCIQKDPVLQEMVQERLVEAVDGMFLLARLYMDSLLDKRTPKQVKTALDTLSKGSKGSNALDSAYAEALQRIESQLFGDRELARNVLSWITLAKRSLTTAEICCALAVEPEDTALNPENALDVDDLVSVCAGLVVVDPESAIIRLVHYTTQEYFERTKDEWNPNAQLYIASTCLTYLSFGVFKSGSCTFKEDFEKKCRENALLVYAAKYWGEHAETVQHEVCKLAFSFLTQIELVSCAAQALYGYMGGSREGFRSMKTTGLHLTSRFGLFFLSEAISLDRTQEIASTLNYQDDYGQIPLLVATRHGHSKIVDLLLRKGANIDALSKFRVSALQLASLQGNEHIVRLLISKGAEINAQGGIHGNALQAASLRGNELIVRLLISKGAEVNAQGEFYGNALQVASLQGNEQIVRLLISKGAEVNAQGGIYGNALQAASLQGKEQIVRLLISEGAEVNAQGGYHGNALQAASFQGQEHIVELLLKIGANINAQGGEYGNALQAASREGHEQVVRLLIDKGADVNAQGGHYGNALCAASIEGHEQVVKLLVEKGADVNAKGGRYGNALQSASSRSHNGIIKLLVNSGAVTDRGSEDEENDLD